MTVKVYISRNHDGTEQSFRETYERSAALQIAKVFWRHYNSVQNKLYALVFNLQSPPADIVVISNDGLGVVDMKHIGNRVEGDEKSPWQIVSANGVRTTIENNHINPARQVGKYKYRIQDELQSFGKAQDMPDWLKKGEFNTQGAILFTSDRFSDDGINLSPDYKRWLRLLWLDNVADWAYALSFAKKRSQHLYLNNRQIEQIATEYFGCSPWNEIDGFLTGGVPYGYLFLIEGGLRRLRISLETEMVSIGRSRENDVPIEAAFVSGRHCRICRKPEGTFIEDLGSGNGTWLNGRQIKAGETHKLQSGNEIVLGPMRNGQAHEHSVILKYLASTETKTAATVIYGK